MSGGHYSLGEVRRSIKSFLFGKMTSSAVGIVLLLVLVRALSPSDYGAYIIFLALMELLQLGSNAGTYVAASRYTPEARLSGDPAWLKACLVALVSARTLTLAPACVLAAASGVALGHFIDLPTHAVLAFRIFTLVIFLEGLARYLDLVFDSLLMQGTAQFSIVLRNGLRLIFLLVLMSGGSEVSLIAWVCAEAAAALVGCLVSGIAMWRFVSSLPTGDNSAPSLASLIQRYIRFSFPFYLGQILGMAHGGDTARLVLAKVTSLEAVAGFGFAGALAATLRRYMPVVLFAGMLRPLFVVAHSRGATGKELAQRADMAFRLCLFALMPIAVLISALDTAIVSLLSGNRFPEISALILIFLGLVACYCARAVLEMLASCYEGGRDMFFASACALGVAASSILVLWLSLGTISPEVMAGVLFASEVVFIFVGLRMLRASHGVTFRPALRCYARLLLAGAVSAAVGRAFVAIVGAPASLGAAEVGGISAALLVVFFAVSAAIKPFALAERDMLNAALGRRLFHW